MWPAKHSLVLVWPRWAQGCPLLFHTHTYIHTRCNYMTKRRQENSQASPYYSLSHIHVGFCLCPTDNGLYAVYMRVRVPRSVDSLLVHRTKDQGDGGHRWHSKRTELVLTSVLGAYRQLLLFCLSTVCHL
jgi:hypothetical protein